MLREPKIEIWINKKAKDEPGRPGDQPSSAKLGGPNAMGRPGAQRPGGPTDNFGGNKPPGGVEMQDVKIDMEGGEEEKNSPGKKKTKGPGGELGDPPARGPGASHGGPPKRINRPGEDDDEKEEDLDGYDDEGKPFFTRVVNRFPKSITWYWMVVAFAAARAATPFGVTVGYLLLIPRIVQVVGAFVDKPLVGYIGYGISVFLMLFLYGIAMIHEGDD